MYRVDVNSRQLVRLTPTTFADMGLKERFDIQEWIEKSPVILGEDLLVIGKEYVLPTNRRVDLLCIDKNASLVVVELKRDDSGDTVEWQAIKYASYCSSLTPDELYGQYANYCGHDIREAARQIEEFIDTDIEALNSKQRIILASKEFNSEVISAVLWLREHGVDLQCTRLAPFLDTDGQLFIKPETIVPLPEAKDYIDRKESKSRNVSSITGEWTGCWFVNIGDGPHRRWEDCEKYGFISAGQGARFSKQLVRLSVGDRIYAYIAGRGYVGFGEVVSGPVMIRDFKEAEKGLPLLNCELAAERPHENSDDEALSEWVVGIRWIKTLPKEEAKTFPQAFANQSIVCKLRNAETLQFVQQEFGK